MKKLLLLFVLIISLSACSRKVLIQEAYEMSASEQQQNQDVVVKTYYGGDAFSHITFQIDLENNSSDTLYIQERDVELRLTLQGRRSTVIKPLRKDDIIYSLQMEEERLEGEKKYTTAANVVMAGTGILAGVLGGAGATESIIVGTGSAIDITDSHQRYGAAQGSILEQISYHETYTLGTEAIPPGGTGSYDVHFNTDLVDCVGELTVYAGGYDHVTEYELVVTEVKERDIR